MTVPSTVKFPLGKTGGLIEALGAGQRIRRQLAGFRWVKPGGLIEAAHSAWSASLPLYVSAG